MNYEKQAEDFAKKVGLNKRILNTSYGRMTWDDKHTKRYIFKIKLVRGDIHSIQDFSFILTFGQSIHAGDKKPTWYDILTCLTKYDPESLEDFCSCFGYDIEEEDTKRVYYSVLTEWENVEQLIPTEFMEEFREIC